jgi:hypothetical protein
MNIILKFKYCKNICGITYKNIKQIKCSKRYYSITPKNEDNSNENEDNSGENNKGSAFLWLIIFVIIVNGSSNRYS